MADKNIEFNLKVMINRKRYRILYIFLTEKKRGIEPRKAQTFHSHRYFGAKGIIGLGTGTYVCQVKQAKKCHFFLFTFASLWCRLYIQFTRTCSSLRLYSIRSSFFRSCHRFCFVIESLPVYIFLFACVCFSLFPFFSLLVVALWNSWHTNRHRARIFVSNTNLNIKHNFTSHTNNIIYIITTKCTNIIAQR